MFEGKVVVVTGGAKGIGKTIVEQFRQAGATVCIIDLLPNDYYVGDLADQTVLEDFARKVIADHGRVDYLIHNALPLTKGLDSCTYEEFNYALRVGVTAPFYLTKLFTAWGGPFGCLPNHIVAKGMARTVKEKCPEANIVAIDYDPGATRVNQENRIKLMLSIARENLKHQEKEPATV